MGGGISKINLSNGALSVTNVGATIGAAGTPLTQMTLTNSSLTLAVKSATPTVQVDAYFATGGATNTINITALPLLTSLPAQFPVIAFVPADILVDGEFNLGLGTLPPGDYAGYISNNTANFSVDLVITAGPVTPILTWDGAASGDWDTSTANWKTNGVLATYQQGYPLVQFDDTLTGTNTVTLTTSLTPGSLTVNNTSTNYVFNGPGKLSGTTSLLKSGAGLLVIDNSGSNDFTGGTTIAGGKLQIGAGDANGNLPVGAISDNGSLTFNRADNIVVANGISGLGGLVQVGPGVLTLSGTNSFADVTTVAGGTLQVGNAAALGTTAGGTVVTNSATLDVNGFSLGLEPVTVSGAGLGGTGAIVNNGASQSKVLRLVTLAGNAAFGGSGDWDISASANAASDASLSSPSGAYRLTKLGTNTLTLLGVLVDPNLSDIDIQSGTLSLERNTSGAGNPTNTLTVFSNATLQIVNLSNIITKPLALNDGATLKSGSGANTFGGPLTLLGADTISVSGVSLTLTNVLSGSGSLTKTLGGTLFLSAANTYSGSTVVSVGTLALSGAGAISGSNIIVAAGATLDATGRSDGTLTLGTGQSLSGNGTVLGAVIAGDGSILAPGSSVGALTISNALNLRTGSATLMELNKGAGTNDQVRGLTAVTYGGKLTVTGLGGAYASGDTFKLFSAATYNASSFDTLVLPVGVSWDTSGLTVDGTIKVISVAPPQLSSIRPVAGGAFQMTFSGPAGNNYRVWANSDVTAAPVSTTWTLVASGLFDSTGVAAFTDTTAANYPARFYVISVP
jgi:autotransporter-associated beta strand protein